MRYGRSSTARQKWHGRYREIDETLGKDTRTGEEKSGTKSDSGVREVPIHENLWPLLEAMHGAASCEDERIVPLVGAARLFERFADQTRRHLKLAGIDRAELIVGTKDLMPFDFRSWRTTGCMWLAMLGTDSYVIALQAGHKSPDTTWSSYTKCGPDLRQRYGEPFPSLPPELGSEANRAKHRAKLEKRREMPGKSSGEGGIRKRAATSSSVAGRCRSWRRLRRTRAQVRSVTLGDPTWTGPWSRWTAMSTSPGSRGRSSSRRKPRSGRS